MRPTCTPRYLVIPYIALHFQVPPPRSLTYPTVPSAHQTKMILRKGWSSWMTYTLRCRSLLFRRPPSPSLKGLARTSVVLISPFQRIAFRLARNEFLHRKQSLLSINGVLTERFYQGNMLMSLLPFGMRNLFQRRQNVIGFGFSCGTTPTGPFIPCLRIQCPR